jgi:Leucine-rich repeat (LRR) protein
MIEVFPENILLLKNLKRIDLSKNEITTTPPSGISLLTDLKYLNMRFNNLKAWPSHLNKCPNLEIIDLGYNKLKEISFFFFQNIRTYDILPSLKTLDISSNYITTFPKNILRFPSLENLGKSLKKKININNNNNNKR